MKKTFTQIFNNHIELLSIEKQKLYNVLKHKIIFDELNGEINLFNLLHEHKTVFLDPDYDLKGHFYVRLFNGQKSRKPFNSSLDEINTLLTPKSMIMNESREFLVKTILKILDEYSENRLLRLFMSPSSGKYLHKSDAMDTLLFMNWIDNTNIWYDLLYEDRVNHYPHHYTFYTLNTPGPGWGLSTYKLKKIKNYRNLGRWSVRSRFRNGKENRFPLWSVLFALPKENLPNKLKEYIVEMQIPVELFQKYRNEYFFKTSLLDPRNKDLLQ